MRSVKEWLSKFHAEDASWINFHPDFKPEQDPEVGDGFRAIQSEALGWVVEQIEDLLEQAQIWEAGDAATRPLRELLSRVEVEQDILWGRRERDEG